jgi:hypothetical protein
MTTKPPVKARENRLAIALGQYVRNPSPWRAREVAHEYRNLGDVELEAAVGRDLMFHPHVTAEDLADAIMRAVLQHRKVG